MKNNTTKISAKNFIARSNIKRESILFLLLLLLISAITIGELFNTGLPSTHDGQDHVARIANFYTNLSEGNVVPRWAGNLNWGYGHPILMFLYPLPSFLASLFHLFGLSFVDATKAVFGLSMILSGITMYVWLKEFLDIRSAFVGGLLYIFAPYRFVDLYVRGAIGEHVAFIFPPLVLYFLLQMSKKITRFNFAGASFSIAGLILAHNAISLMFVPVIILYAIFLVANTKKSYLLFYYLSIMVLGFGMASFFWLPAYVEGKYTLRDIVTKGGYLKSFVNFSDFLYGPWSYGGSGLFTVQIGIVQWIFILFSIPGMILFFRGKNLLWIAILVSLVLFGFVLFLMTPGSTYIWQKVTLIQKFQFPWRFLSLTVFLSAFLAAVTFSVATNKLKNILLVLIIIAVISLNRNYWHAKDFQVKPEQFYSGVYYGTTDTGESAPIWSIRFMEHIPNAPVEVISGNASVSMESRNTTLHRYSIDAIERSRIRENTLYFPGWVVVIDGTAVNIEFQDPLNRGLITYYVDAGKHNIEVRFSETKLRQVANIISAVSLSFTLLLFLPWTLIQKRYRNR